MPRGAERPRRTVRVESELWEPAHAIAEARGENLSQHVLRPALVNYIKKNKPKESK